jgi:hypothetical protein
MKMRCLILFLFSFLLTLNAQEIEQEWTLEKEKEALELVSPRYFGPNALPVPDMLDGRISSTLRLELAGDAYRGFTKDHTADIFFRAFIPLFTPRLNLTVWMPVCEWFKHNAETQRDRYIQDTLIFRDHGMGDVYLSLDIQALYARRWCPDIAVRAALKTASGGQFAQGRHFDSPAYFFDASIGKSLYITPLRKVTTTRTDIRDWEIRAAFMLGFLCWQTVTNKQNDALLYGVQLFVKQQYISTRLTWSGYSGWKHNGDKPMTVKAELRGYVKGFEPFAMYQYGLRDYTFHQVRVGLAYNIDILNSIRLKKKQKG